MLHVLLEKLIDYAQRVFIWCSIEIKRPAEKITGRIGKKELIGRGRISADIEIDTADTIGGLDHGLIDRTGFQTMLERHLESIFPQFFELIWPYGLVADIDTAVKPGKIDIDPVGILRNRIKKTTVLEHIGVHRIFECIRKTGLIEHPVFMLREVDLKITPPLGSVNTIAG